MDSAVLAAWIGVTGTVIAGAVGTLLGYRLTESAAHRHQRETAAGQLADLTQLLYPPRDAVDLDVALARLAIGLRAASVSRQQIAELRTLANACQQSAYEFASHNPEANPAISVGLKTEFENLVGVLGEELLPGESNLEDPPRRTAQRLATSFVSVRERLKNRTKH